MKLSDFRFKCEVGVLWINRKEFCNKIIDEMDRVTLISRGMGAKAAHYDYKENGWLSKVITVVGYDYPEEIVRAIEKWIWKIKQENE